MKEIWKYDEREITCPYCGYEYSDSWECGRDEDEYSDNEECPECGKIFHWIRHIDVSYESRGLCAENKVDHDWEGFDFISEKDGSRVKGRKCSCCDTYEFDKEDPAVTNESK